MPDHSPIDTNAPLIVTLGFDDATFDRLDHLRRRFSPFEPNLEPAHLPLFRSLPTAEAGAIASELAGAADAFSPIALEFPDVRPLGTGFALAVEAPDLLALHSRLAEAFSGWVSPQDRHLIRPQITVVNRSTRRSSRLALIRYRAEFEPWAGTAESLLLWADLGGPWQPLARYPFSGPERSPSED